MRREPGLPEEPFWTWSKVTSLLVVALYALPAIWLGEPIDAPTVFIVCLSPLALIWFPEVFGDPAATNTLFGAPTIKPTPARLVWLGGWLLLLLPLIRIGIILYLAGTEGLSSWPPRSN